MTLYNSDLPNIHTLPGQTQTVPALPATAITALSAPIPTIETTMATLPAPLPLRAGYNSLVPDIGLYRHLSHAVVAAKKTPKQHSGKGWHLLKLLLLLTGRPRAQQQRTENKKIKMQDEITENQVTTQPKSASVIHNKAAITGVSAQKNGVIRHER